MSPNALEAVDLCVEGTGMEMKRGGRSGEEYSLWSVR
jgi:hypothetical protein